MESTIKTIDIQAKEWFDKVNGNSYFAAIATINFGTEDEKEVKLPFQYGYGDHYVDMATKELEKAGIITDLEHYGNGGSEAIWNYCTRKGIILRRSKQAGCLKRDLKNFV